jgi:hypothetical protein
MRPPREALLDIALALGGAALSTLFFSTDGNGQNPFPVGAGMLLVALITGAVSFALAGPVRSILLAMAASGVITELLFVLYFVCRVAFSEHVDDHAFEELYLLPLVFALYTAPTVLFSTIGFGRLANRFYRRGKVAG